ncbi:serine O-acetyltransferase [uncultured Faecalicoccus sp.]|uniref:serine O-acetyltransferase n=1 Tax=uncultured Faecalicoccus sp. TaxID=1971760 RepID=UPI00258F84F5|nr:hypothetical protein [uncultured Faecalicoccus sp.]
MIRTYKELKETIMYEKPLYPNSLFDYLTNNQRVYNWKFIKLLRYTEYFHNNIHRGILYKILYVFYRRKKNTLGVKIGVEIDAGSFEKGLIIHHNGNIVISSNAKIGENCELHGDNCIGNLGRNLGKACPIIGNNVDIGVGAKILGPIKLGNNVKIGANAIVIKSFEEDNITLVGIPAHKIEKG